MKKILVLVSTFLISTIAFTQEVYTFTGNGYWTARDNWHNNTIPPAILPRGSAIIIDPEGNAACILNTLQTISAGATLTVQPGKKFMVMGNLILSAVAAGNSDSTFKDLRDGHIYTFKHIGSQVWMTQNLKFTFPIPACYNNNPGNCSIYGGLYSWADALTVAPPGWHLPSENEWKTLETFLGGDGGALKDSILWNSPNNGATNASGFAALPGGLCYTNGTFDYAGSYGYWWSSTESGVSFAQCRGLYYGNSVIFSGGSDKTFLFSVRCIRD